MPNSRIRHLLLGFAGAAAVAAWVQPPVFIEARAAATRGPVVLRKGRGQQRGRPAASRGSSPEFNRAHCLGVADVLGARAADVPAARLFPETCDRWSPGPTTLGRKNISVLRRG